MTEPDDDSRRRISSWLPLGVAIVFCASSFYLLGLYSTAPCSLGPCAARVHLDVIEIRRSIEAGVSRAEGAPPILVDEHLQRLEGCVEQFRAAASTLMARTAVYHLTGLLGFVA